MYYTFRAHCFYSYIICKSNKSMPLKAGYTCKKISSNEGFILLLRVIQKLETKLVEGQISEGNPPKRSKNNICGTFIEIFCNILIAFKRI